MGWIKSDERLPIEEQYHIGPYEIVDVICFDGKEVFVSYFEAGSTVDYWSRFDADGVTHWMPLPDKPKQ